MQQRQRQRLALNLSLLSSIALLKADAAALSAWLEEQAAANPALVLARQAPAAWLPRWSSAFSGHGVPGHGPEPVAGAPGLVAHVLEQVRRLDPGPEEARIAAELVDALAPSGWLDRPLESIARAAGVAVPRAAAVLARLQGMEPAGLFARDLAECLRLQAGEAGELDAAMAGVLGCLPLVASGDHAAIARRIGESEAVVLARIARLRRYDPKPGARYSQGAAVVAEPDLIVRRGPGGWEVELNRSSLPTLSVAAGRGGGQGAARAVLRLIEGRNATLLALAREIVSHQRAALEDGLEALLPMTMADLAEAMGLHQATVSRLVAGTSMDTPRGTLWLRALFSGRVSPGGAAGAALRERLARLVAAEDPARALTDEALAAALGSPPGSAPGPGPGSPPGPGGAPVARRTVAKYRAMLGIPPAHQRRRAARLKVTARVVSGPDSASAQG